MESLDDIGGVAVVMKLMLEAGMLHGDCMTVTGRTIAENLSTIREATSTILCSHTSNTRHALVLMGCL